MFRMPTAPRQMIKSALTGLLTFCLVLTGQILNAQTYSWAWGKAFNTSAIDEVTGAAIDNATGATYTCGFTMGSGLFSGTSGNVSGSKDAFLIKYDAAGTQQWAFTSGGSGDSRATGVALDVAGNIYITGWFTGTIDLNGLSLTGSGLVTSSGNVDWFVASYTPSGMLRWRAKVGGSGEDQPVGIAVNSTGVSVFGHVRKHSNNIA